MVVEAEPGAEAGIDGVVFADVVIIIRVARGFLVGEAHADPEGQLIDRIPKGACANRPDLLDLVVIIEVLFLLMIHGGDGTALRRDRPRLPGGSPSGGVRCGVSEAHSSRG